MMDIPSRASRNPSHVESPKTMSFERGTVVSEVVMAAGGEGG